MKVFRAGYLDEYQIGDVRRLCAYYGLDVKATSEVRIGDNFVEFDTYVRGPDGKLEWDVYPLQVRRIRHRFEVPDAVEGPGIRG